MHGTIAMWDRGCRCDSCRLMYVVYASIPPKLRKTFKPEMHGTLTGYTYGCRRDCCRAARRRWEGSGNELVDAGQFVPALRELSRTLTQPELAAMTGVSRETLSRIMCGKRTKVRAQTARQLERLFLVEAA